MSDEHDDGVGNISPVAVDITPAQIASNENPNIILENVKNDFVSWQTGGKVKSILCDLFESGDNSIGSDKYPVGDQSTWNVFNIQANRSDKFPDRPPSYAMKVTAKNWMLLFRSYALEYMKKKVMSNYLLLFNGEKYCSLRGENHSVVSFQKMTEILKDYKNEEV